MGQVWTVLSLDTRTRGYPSKLGEFIWGGSGRRMVYLFAKSEVALQFVPSQKQEPSAVATQQRSPILNLPTEILVQIFDELSAESCLQLTMSCRKLWHVGWDVLERILQGWYRSWTWAGSRIIFIGEYCWAKEHPRGLLTAAEEKELEDGLDQDELDEFVEVGELVEDHRMKPGVPISLHDLGWFRYPEAPLDTDPLHLGLGKGFRGSKLPSAEQLFVWDFLLREKTELFPSKEIWILRNLSAKEFVRGDYLYSSFQEDNCPFGPDIGYPGLADAIFCRVCWSTDTSTAPVDRMCKGPWVGHRFEIRCLSGHILNSDASWKDVSSDVAAELSQICGIELRSKDNSEAQNGEETTISHDVECLDSKKRRGSESSLPGGSKRPAIRD